MYKNNFRTYIAQYKLGTKKINKDPYYKGWIIKTKVFYRTQIILDIF
ncbi:hypothetical protein [Candidatus Karelsulcia muelleri]|nr:hypothetical protein [Candidatus Karelsulcia muelleri]NJJ98664.1 hypothetical protein [Candidatus Karelsulcia muelleri]